jgi:ribosomal protein L1
MDNLTTCDRCGSDACYVQEVNNEIKNYMCYGCGFVTNSLMKKGEKFFEEQFEILPELYKELMGEDEKGKIWMPNTVNMHNKGMVFADGTRASNWMWAAVKAVPMPEDEREKFKIKGKDYKWKMDMETMKHFPESDFMDALDYIGVFNREQ